MNSNSNYTTAFKLLTLGYSVIPSGGGDKGKAPLVNWKDYQTTRADEKQLDAWENELHPTLWGIITNDTIAVIDADTAEARAMLEAEIGEPHVLTPGGGAHWYIETTGHPMKTCAKIVPGIDVRGVGGFVNITGGKYQIIRMPVPEDIIPWATLPKRILSAMNGSKPKAEIRPGSAVPVGQRNDTLARIAGAMRRQGAGQAAIEGALLNVVCEVPLPEVEIRAIAASVGRYLPAPPAAPPKQQETAITYIDQVTETKVNFLWEPYIPIGKLTLLEGDPGVGKSWVTLAIATAV
ncbi:bifunctional DNA primase/polymerase, partial [Chloroflexota bacterium]